jgi:hypothetical protein
MINYFSAIKIAAALFLSVIVTWQHKKISELKMGNSELLSKAMDYQRANAELISEYSMIREALEDAAKKKAAAEAESQSTRKKLLSAQSGVACANYSVPADVIRMQREAIAAANKKFTLQKP